MPWGLLPGPALAMETPCSLECSSTVTPSEPVLWTPESPSQGGLLTAFCGVLWSTAQAPMPQAQQTMVLDAPSIPCCCFLSSELQLPAAPMHTHLTHSLTYSRGLPAHHTRPRQSDSLDAPRPCACSPSWVHLTGPSAKSNLLGQRFPGEEDGNAGVQLPPPLS